MSTQIEQKKKIILKTDKKGNGKKFALLKNVEEKI
jgi:hypothetical protein